MKEKHVFKFISMLFVILLGMAMTTSCSKDDDDDNGSGNTLNYIPLEGKTVKKVHSDMITYWYFKRDNTFTRYLYSKDWESDDESYELLSKVEGHYYPNPERPNTYRYSNDQRSDDNGVMYFYQLSNSYELSFGNHWGTGSSWTHSYVTLENNPPVGYDAIYADGSPYYGESHGGSNDDTNTPSIVTGKVTATVKAIGPGVAYDSYAQYVNGKTTKVDYEYYPKTGKYYVYGGIYDSHPESNGGKGLRYDAQKGYNSITIYYDYYYDYSMRISYQWELVLKVTLP